MSTLNPGDEIIIPEPFYANYTAFAIMCGVKVKTVTSTIENGFALPPISEIEKQITPKTKGIVIINPNNPTGYLYTQEELEELAKIVKKYDLYLYSDEVYRRYCYDGLKHFSVMKLKRDRTKYYSFSIPCPSVTANAVFVSGYHYPQS